MSELKANYQIEADAICKDAEEAAKRIAEESGDNYRPYLIGVLRYKIERLCADLEKERTNKTVPAEFYNTLAEWADDGACGCETAMCTLNCLPARTELMLETYKKGE